MSKHNGSKKDNKERQRDENTRIETDRKKIAKEGCPEVIIT